MTILYPLACVMCIAALALMVVSGRTRNAIYGDMATILFVGAVAMLFSAAMKTLAGLV